MDAHTCTRVRTYTHTHRIIHKPAIFMNIDWLMAFINHCHLIQSTKSIIAPPILMLLIINVHIIIIKPSIMIIMIIQLQNVRFFHNTLLHSSNGMTKNSLFNENW